LSPTSVTKKFYMIRNHQQGSALVRIVIIIIVFCLLVGGGFFLINNEKAKTRDARRLSDMARIQAAFEFLYNDTASYEGAANNGCDAKGSLVSQCNLKAYLPSIASFKDPGKYRYVVSTVPSDESYAVSFTIEKSYGTLNAGTHVLTPQGIK